MGTGSTYGNCVGATLMLVGSPAADNTIFVGGVANITLPATVDDKDQVGLSLDGYGRLEVRAFSRATDTIMVTDQAPAKIQKSGPYAMTQLVAAGSTAAINARNYSNVSVMVVVASLEAGQFCELSLEGSTDNVSWGNLSADDKDTRITANGTYIFRASNIALEYVRFTMDTDSVGGAVTVDPDIMLGN